MSRDQTLKSMPPEKWEAHLHAVIGNTSGAEPSMIEATDKAAKLYFNYVFDGQTEAFVELDLFPHYDECEIGFVFVEKDAKHIHGREIVQDIIGIAETLGCTQLKVSARDVGSYFWARCGFAPDETMDWSILRDGIFSRLGKIYLGGREEAGHLINQAIESDNSNMLAVIADSVLGKELLLNQEWEGTLDLTDEVARGRLEAYTQSPTRYQSQEEGIAR